jgi:hypothetical protein
VLILTTLVSLLTGAPAHPRRVEPPAASIVQERLSPERTVVGTSVVSQSDPAVTVEIPAGSRYVGADRWILYGYDDVELHVFTEADADNRVRNFHWIQFEAYVPERPELSHAGHYDSSRRIVVDGLEFYLDAWVRSEVEVAPAGSDLEHVDSLLRDKGYDAPADAMYVRLVHLPDAAMRKELMIIYVEDLAPTGLTATDLDEGGPGRGRWPDIEQQLIERAVGGLTLRR